MVVSSKRFSREILWLEDVRHKALASTIPSQKGLMLPPIGEEIMSPRICLLSVCVTTFWASAFVCIQRSSSLIDPGSFAVYRLLISSATLFLIAKFRGMKSIPRKDQLRVAMSGCAGSSLYILFINMAQPYATSTESCIIINTVPALSTLGGWLFLKQTINMRVGIGLGVSFLGIVFLSYGEGGFHLNLGIGFLLLAAVSMASSLILQKDLLSKYSSLQVISTGLWWGTLATLPFAPGFLMSLDSLSLEAHLLIIYLGIFPSALVYLAWGVLLKSLATHQATSLLYVIPVLVAVMGYFFLGETLNLSVVIGGAFALGGVALIQLPSPKLKKFPLVFLKKAG